jgi:hypothetical protein
VAQASGNPNVFSEPVAVLREPGVMIESELSFSVDVVVQEIAATDEPLGPQNAKTGQFDLSHWLVAPKEKASPLDSLDLNTDGKENLYVYCIRALIIFPLLAKLIIRPFFLVAFLPYCYRFELFAFRLDLKILTRETICYPCKLR